MSTLSDDTIKLPTSGEIQKVGKIGLHLSEAEPLLMLACMEDFLVVIDGGNPEMMMFLLES